MSMASMKIAIGCDPNAKDLKKYMWDVLKDNGYEVADYGSEDPIYANTALKVAEAVASGECDRGMLFCGTGLGVCLAANKVPGAYAVVCGDEYSMERSILSNNANILTFGQQVHGPLLARSVALKWLSLEYKPGGRSQAKIDRIYEIEKNLGHS